MTTIFKYIIVDAGAIIFPDNPLCSHKQVASQFPKVYAAGFVKLKCTCNGYSAQVFGRSESLDIDSTDQDELVIKETFNPSSPIKYHLVTVKSFYTDNGK